VYYTPRKYFASVRTNRACSCKIAFSSLVKQITIIDLLDKIGKRKNKEKQVHFSIAASVFKIKFIRAIRLFKAILENFKSDKKNNFQESEMQGNRSFDSTLSSMYLFCVTYQNFRRATVCQLLLS
jgi:hypothetical protein